MILSLLQDGLTRNDLVMMLLTIPVVLISLCFHELSHGFIAYKLGDPTAKWHGRLTLNPIKHLDPLGTLSMALFGIGWAKPVPVNVRNFKNPKKGMAIVGIAGPVSNLILAFIGSILHRITWVIATSKPVTDERVFFAFQILIWLFYMFEYLNIYLAVFNLIPVPPFDGSRIFYFLLPDKYYFGVMRYERQIMLITMALLFTGALRLPLTFITDKIMWLFDLVIGLVPFL